MNLTGQVRLNQRRTVLAKYVPWIPVAEFDTPEICMILSGRSQQVLLFFVTPKCQGAPIVGRIGKRV